LARLFADYYATYVVRFDDDYRHHDYADDHDTLAYDTSRYDIERYGAMRLRAHTLIHVWQAFERDESRHAIRRCLRDVKSESVELLLRAIMRVVVNGAL